MVPDDFPHFVKKSFAPFFLQIHSKGEAGQVFLLVWL